MRVLHCPSFTFAHSSGGECHMVMTRLKSRHTIKYENTKETLRSVSEAFFNHDTFSRVFHPFDFLVARWQKFDFEFANSISFSFFFSPSPRWGGVPGESTSILFFTFFYFPSLPGVMKRNVRKPTDVSLFCLSDV